MRLFLLIGDSALKEPSPRRAKPVREVSPSRTYPNNYTEPLL
ncbi:hypothetical protein ANRL4_05031 [Anaerolineae bacterium]|nr:hypothetical protein ANRL4_05031 [Anaerolineae bacterium]